MTKKDRSTSLSCFMFTWARFKLSEYHPDVFTHK